MVLVIHLLTTELALAASSLATGAMLLTAVALEPLTAGWSDEEHRQAKARVQGGVDRMMPAIVLLALGCSLVSAGTTTVGPRWPASVAAVTLVAGVLVSVTMNVPLNRALVRPIEAGSGPTRRAQRQRWRRWHAVRSVLVALATASLLLAGLTTHVPR